jgi:hypothetical protein
MPASASTCEHWVSKAIQGFDWVSKAIQGFDWVSKAIQGFDFRVKQKSRLEV